MTSKTLRKKITLAIALTAAALLVASCGSDSTAGDAPTAAQQADSGAPSNESPADAGSTPQGSASGSVTVDGVTVTFTPDICITDGGLAFTGAGTTDDGVPAYVDSGDTNQLNVYLGTDDPFGEAEAAYEHAEVLADLAGLQIDGSQVTATPEMVRVDDGSYAPVGPAELHVTCD